MSELKKDSVERTLCIPLWSRAIAVKKLPQILPDYDAVRILKEMGETKPPTILYNLECGALAGAIRQYDFACEIREHLKDHPHATIVELGAGLSCLRRQLKNEINPWINIDFPDVIVCREKYIPIGAMEKNVACDITDHEWFDEIPFEKENGVIFLAAGVLHYLTYDAVYRLYSHQDTLSGRRRLQFPIRSSQDRCRRRLGKEQKHMSKFEGVADTLYIPLTARIYVSEHFPEYFRDNKAASLKSEMPYEEIASKSSEYFQMAGACRFYNTDRMIKAFIDRYEKCNIVNVGCGLETAYFRINPASEKAVFYEMDLPEVIAARRKVLGESENEILISGDMFDFAWADGIDKSLPTLVTVIGVFQYFEEEKVIGFLKQLKRSFPGVEVIFDAMTGKAIKYANDYIKKTGNNDAELHFSADNGQSVASKCGMKLIEERPFFGTARKQLKRKLKLYTRIAMKVVDEGGRRGFLTHLKG